MFGTFAQGEVIGEGETDTLIEATRVPVFVRGKLQVAEQVETKSDLVVCFVGNELGKRGHRDDHCDEGEKYFLHFI